MASNAIRIITIAVTIVMTSCSDEWTGKEPLKIQFELAFFTLGQVAACPAALAYR